MSRPVTSTFTSRSDIEDGSNTRAEYSLPTSSRPAAAMRSGSATGSVSPWSRGIAVTWSPVPAAIERTSVESPRASPVTLKSPISESRENSKSRS